MHISEVPKFLADSPSETTNAVLRPLWFSPPTNNQTTDKQSNQLFWCVGPKIAEYENEEIPKINETAKEPPWDPPT